MARPKEFDETTALEKAIEVFWEKGYEATSISDLEKKMGLGRQSIYNTFGDKHQVFLKALERYGDRNAESLSHLTNGEESGLEAIRAFFARTVRHLTPKGPRKACLIVNTALELGGRDKEVGNTCKRNQDRMLVAFRKALTTAIERGEIRAETDVDSTARMLSSQVYGMSVLAKSGATTKQLQDVANRLLDRVGG